MLIVFIFSASQLNDHQEIHSKTKDLISVYGWHVNNTLVKNSYANMHFYCLDAGN